MPRYLPLGTLSARYFHATTDAGRRSELIFGFAHFCAGQNARIRKTLAAMPDHTPDLRDSEPENWSIRHETQGLDYAAHGSTLHSTGKRKPRTP